MKRSGPVVLVLALLVACGGGGGPGGGNSGDPTSPYTTPGTPTGGTPSTPSVPATNEIIGTASNAFNPTSLSVAKGTTVTFTFQAEHNVNFDAVTGAPANIATQSSGSVARAFSTAGTFGFNCTLHSGMRGTVVVN